VDATQRLSWNGKTLLISGVRVIDRSWIELLCTEES
jgi:hypothetical protein